MYMDISYDVWLLITFGCRNMFIALPIVAIFPENSRWHNYASRELRQAKQVDGCCSTVTQKLATVLGMDTIH